MDLPVLVYILPKTMAADSRGLALRCADAYARAFGLPPPTAILQEDGGKPRTDSRVCLSVSHTGPLWACALHSRAVGLDIQMESARPFNAIARRFFCPEDAEYLAKNPGDFFKLWCAKEAIVKYHGEGLRAFRHRPAATAQGLAPPEGGAALLHFKLARRCAGCLCCDKNAPVSIRFTPPPPR